MNILIVASKFPPEYAGPGVRIPKLYKAISDELGVKSLNVLCNGVEQTDNEDYQYEDFAVKRRVAQSLRKNRFPFNFLPFSANLPNSMSLVLLGSISRENFVNLFSRAFWKRTASE